MHVYCVPGWEWGCYSRNQSPERTKACVTTPPGSSRWTRGWSVTPSRSLRSPVPLKLLRVVPPREIRGDPVHFHAMLSRYRNLPRTAQAPPRGSFRIAQTWKRDERRNLKRNLLFPARCTPRRRISCLPSEIPDPDLA